MSDSSSQRPNFRGSLTPEEKADLPTQGQSAVAGVQLEELPQPEKKQSSELEYLSVRNGEWREALECDCAQGVVSHSTEWPKGSGVLWNEEYGSVSSEAGGDS